MRLYFQSQKDCDVYSFENFSSDFSIVLPEEISFGELLIFLQGSLDRIRPVLIVKNNSTISSVNLSELSKVHHRIEKEKFIFLNYSIRNAFSKFKNTAPMINGFAEIEAFFAENFPKNH